MYAKNKRVPDFSETLPSYLIRLELNSNRIQYHTAAAADSIIGVGCNDVTAKYINITTDTTNNNAESTAIDSIILFFISLPPTPNVYNISLYTDIFSRREKYRPRNFFLSPYLI